MLSTIGSKEESKGEEEATKESYLKPIGQQMKQCQPGKNKW